MCGVSVQNKTSVHRLNIKKNRTKQPTLKLGIPQNAEIEQKVGKHITVF